MIRIFLFFTVLLVAAFGLSWLADQPGTVSLSFNSKIYEVSLLIGGLILFALSLTLVVLWSIVRFVFRLPSLVSLSNRLRRRSKGMTAISKGMIAVGSGDSRAAQHYADQAQRLLGIEPLALLLKAQALQLSNKRDDAGAAFKKMLENPETQVLGLRGLFFETRRKGDLGLARQYAEEAHQIAPHIAWASQSVLEYATLDANWDKALKIVDQNASRHVLGKHEAHRQRAVLLCAKALDLSEKSPEEALKSALVALKSEPSLVPAAVFAAQALAVKGNYSRASKILETAWKQCPHPSLAESYIDVRRGDSALDRLKRARSLAKINPDNRESRFIVANAALQAKEFTVARENLERLVLEKPTARACLMMAELEENEFNNAGAVKEWLARAARAPRDPAWVADGHVSENWAPLSPITGRLDAFTWQEPPQAAEVSARTYIDADKMNEDQKLHSAEDVLTLTMDQKPELNTPELNTVENSYNLKASDTKVLDPKTLTQKPQPIIFPVSQAPDDPGINRKVV